VPPCVKERPFTNSQLTGNGLHDDASPVRCTNPPSVSLQQSTVICRCLTLIQVIGG